LPDPAAQLHGAKPVRSELAAGVPYRGPPIRCSIWDRVWTIRKLSERHCFPDELRLLALIELRRRGRAGSDRNADFHKKPLLSRGRTDADQTRGLRRSIVELTRSIGGDVDSVPASHQGLPAAESCHDLAFEHDEGLFEVVPMGRRPAAWRYVHVDHAEAPVRLIAGDGDRVGVADQADMRKALIAARAGDGQPATKIVGRKRRVLPGLLGTCSLLATSLTECLSPAG